MCRGKRVCTELGDQQAAWSKDTTLPPPAWFLTELDVFIDSVRLAALGDVEGAKHLMGTVRSDDLREWYVEHGANAGFHRYCQLGRPEPDTVSTDLDQLRSPSRFMAQVFERDGYRCRYCGLRLIPKRVMVAFANLVGADSFRPSGKTNQDAHGAGLVFRPTLDHVVPWKLGGRTDPTNLVTSCWSCNYGKSNYTLEQLGLDDPRDRSPHAGEWDGLVSLLPHLRLARNGQTSCAGSHCENEVREQR